MKTMKKILKSLPFQLLLGVIIGIVLGLISNEAVMNVIVTIKFVLGELINFCVPLIVIGFIAPSITKLGKNASRILGVAVLLAYVSSVFSGAGINGSRIWTDSAFVNCFGSRWAERTSGNCISAGDSADQVRDECPCIFHSDGLAATWTRAETVIRLLDEFQQIVLMIVSKIVIPILPVFIALTFWSLAYEGTITKQLPVFLKVVLIVMVGHFIWMAVLYAVGGIYSGNNPWKVVKHYGPAYITAVGTMSSAATLAVALKCARKSEPVLRDDMVSFGIPLFANIHLCGSVLTEVFFVMTVSQILYGKLPSVGTMILFCALLGVFAIGAPGVPGGTVMASLGLITGVLGFDATGTALMLTIFALQDSFGTACNVTGDGALTMILTGYARRHNIEQQTETIEF